MQHNKKKGLAALERGQADTENQTARKGTDHLMFAHATDTRLKHLRAVQLVWTTALVFAAFVVVLSASPIVTDVAIFCVALVWTRLAVVARRRALRAAYRAELWHRMADLEAVQVAGGAHQVTSAA